MKEAKMDVKLPAKVMAYYCLLSKMSGVRVDDVLAVALASQAIRMSPVIEPKKRKRPNAELNGARRASDLSAGLGAGG